MLKVLCVAVVVAALGIGGCVDGVIEASPDALEEMVGEAGGLELIGISGRRVGDGESYRVPLDSERVITLGATAREAMVLVNRGPNDVLVEGLGVVDESGEWRLVAPTRARELPLAATGILLHPEARLDFDVAITALDGGLREAWLELAWREGGSARKRRVLLWARVAGPSLTTGPGPPP